MRGCLIDVAPLLLVITIVAVQLNSSYYRIGWGITEMPSVLLLCPV